MVNHENGTLQLVCVIAAAVGLVSVALVMVVGGTPVSQAFGIGIAVFLVVAIVLYIGFRTPTEDVMRDYADGRMEGRDLAHRAGLAPTVSSTGSAVRELNPGVERAAASVREAAKPYVDGARAHVTESETLQKTTDAIGTAANSAEDAVQAAAVSLASGAQQVADATDRDTARASGSERDAATDGLTSNNDADAHAASDHGQKPTTLDSPRNGQADDLKMIKGVGPKLEEMLNSLGFYHFDQIAAWSQEEVAWVDQNLEGFSGRVTRDNWIDQATVLAAGGETEFSQRASY